MIDVATVLIAFAGFVLLHLAMVRHQHDWLNRRLSPTSCRFLRTGGAMLLPASFAVAGKGFGLGYGAVAWFGWSTVAAATVVALHTSRSRIRRLLGAWSGRAAG